MNGLAIKTDLPSAQSVRLPTGIEREKLERRFWAKVDKNGPNGCWVWTKGVDKYGYAKFRAEGAHRFAYKLLVGPIRAETLDHLCRNRACVNPAHLEPVSNHVNLLRGIGLPAQEARRTHCLKGHPYDLFNTYYRSDGSRRCRTCQRIWDTKRRVGACGIYLKHGN